MASRYKLTYSDLFGETFRCHYGACPKRPKRQFKCEGCFLTFCQQHSRKTPARGRLCIDCERQREERAQRLSDNTTRKLSLDAQLRQYRAQHAGLSEAYERGLIEGSDETYTGF